MFFNAWRDKGPPALELEVALDVDVDVDVDVASEGYPFSGKV